jgi:4-nitrophenol 2-monooxygenase / 4-nitrocatechol 4-monooxygenase, reductase component
VDKKRYREAISHFATGVTIITTLKDGKPVGMTASAVASLSLEPVLLLVCISNKIATHEAIEQSQKFVVNVLGEGDGDLAMRFATPVPDRFAGLELRTEFDLPVIKSAIAHFVCDVHERFPGGDHSIFLGGVVDCSFSAESRPLLYFKSKFGALGV